MKQEKNILSGADLLEHLRSQDWGRLTRKLHYYSLNHLLRFPQLQDRFNINNLATHFADEAIKQLWLEERAWNINYYPDVYDFLKGAVDSLRKNFLSSKEVTTTRFISDAEEDLIVDKFNDPESKFIAKEFQQNLEEQIEAIFKDDLDAYMIFDRLRSAMKPANISQDLNIPVKQVYNAIKRIERKLAELKTKIKQ